MPDCSMYLRVSVCWLAVSLSSMLNAEQPARAKLEKTKEAQSVSLITELERGKRESRLIVYISNATDIPFTFETGAYGGPGSLDDGFRFKGHPKNNPSHVLDENEVIGTAPTVVPEFEFGFGKSGRIYIRAPTFGGPFRRSARPESVTVASNSRVQYASFLVPTRNVSGKFFEATLRLPDDQLLRTRVLTVKAVLDEDG